MGANSRFRRYNTGMSVSERRFALLAGGLTLFVIMFPAGMAVLTAGDGAVFGGMLFNPLDGNSYLAKMYQGWRGEWVFQLPYTPETGRGAYFHFYYILGGHLARLTGLNLVAMFQWMRLGGSALLLLSLWRAFSRMLGSPFERRAAYVISGLCIGSGWVLLLFGVLPADFWIAEAFPLLAMLANPHFPLALAIIMFLAVPPQRVEAYEWSAGLKDALLAFLLGIVSPFGAVIALLPWSGAALMKLLRSIRTDRRLPAGVTSWIEWKKLAAIAIGGLPVIVYSLLAIRADPLLSAWDRQNLTPSPPVWNLLFALSPALLLAFFAKDARADSFAGWAVLSLALVFLPHPLQRRFLMGIHIPLAALAAIGLNELRTRRPLAAKAVSWLFIPGPVILFLVLASGILSRNPLLYYSNDEAAALAWLVEQTPPDSLVLASPEMGMLIPAHSGRRVLYGHPFETVEAEAQRSAVQGFYANFSVEKAQHFLQERRVDYVIFGPREQALGDLPVVASMEAVFERGEVAIYAVRDP